MCTTQFDLFTYNCHLFASLPKLPGVPGSVLDDITTLFSKDSLFADKHRAVAIRQFIKAKQYSESTQVIPIVALQEVWDAELVSSVSLEHPGAADRGRIQFTPPTAARQPAAISRTAGSNSRKWGSPAPTR